MSKVWGLIFCICLAGCTVEITPVQEMPATSLRTSIPTSPPGLQFTATSLLTTLTPTVPLVSPSPSPEAATLGATPSQQRCLIGLGLRDETTEILLEYKDQIGFVMAANTPIAEQYFSQFEGAIRVIGAPSLGELEEKGEKASTSGIQYEALAYGIETSKSTPDEEWNNLIESTSSAKTIANTYGKQLLMGPGFRLLSNNEDKYAPMAALADIWMLQTQQLQKEPPGAEYRKEVQRIVDLIRSGNPDIQIWAQITLPPDRAPDAAEWLEYHRYIEDLVDGTYIGVYTWDEGNKDQLSETIRMILDEVCTNG